MPSPRSSAAGVCVPGLGEGGGILVFGESQSPSSLSWVDERQAESMQVPPRPHFTTIKIWFGHNSVWRIWLKGVVVALQREDA